MRISKETKDLLIKREEMEMTAIRLYNMEFMSPNNLFESGLLKGHEDAIKIIKYENKEPLDTRNYKEGTMKKITALRTLLMIKPQEHAGTIIKARIVALKSVLAYIECMEAAGGIEV